MPVSGLRGAGHDQRAWASAGRRVTAKRTSAAVAAAVAAVAFMVGG